MRTTLRLDADLLAAAKRRAAADGTTFTRLVEDALRAQLAQRPAAPAEWVKLPTFRGEGVLPGVDIENMASLLDLMERDVPLHRLR